MTATVQTDLEGRTCAACPAPLVKHRKETLKVWAKRKYCSVECFRKVNSAHSNQRRNTNFTVNRLRDVEQFLDMFLPADVIAKDLRSSPGHLMEWLRKHDRPDLAERLASAR
jgi:hypothetical protein